MRSKSAFRFAMMLMLSLAVPALAQQRPDGQPGGRGRGGPPGVPFFGGGGGGGFGGGASRMFLLRIGEVRKELELADEQVAAIEKLQEELNAKYPSPFGGRGGGDGDRGRRGRPGDNTQGSLRAPADWYFIQQNQPGQGRRGGGGPPSPEDRARFEQQRAERAKEEKARLAEILLPEQMKRLNEIFVQVSGTGALEDEDIAKEIGINEAQKTKLQQVRDQNREAFGAAMREMFQGGGGGGGGNFEANRAKMDELRKANDAKLLAVLSPDQQKKFEELKGKPFQMPEGFGRGGPGGPGGPGRGRGNRGGNNNNN